MSKRFEWDKSKPMYVGVRDDPHMIMIPLKHECCQELVDICEKFIEDGRDFRNFQVTLYYYAGSLSNDKTEKFYIEDSFDCNYTGFDKDIGKDMIWSAHVFETQWYDLLACIKNDLLSDEKTRETIERKLDIYGCKTLSG